MDVSEYLWSQKHKYAVEAQYKYLWPNGSITQYKVNFITMMQTNMNDARSVRRVRFAWLSLDDIDESNWQFCS